MNYRVILGVLGALLCFLGPLMLIPLLVALYYGESPYPFAISFSVTTVIGSLLLIKFPNSDDEEWEKREGFAIVAFGWMAAALFGSIPFMFDGVTPINSFFESMSGFTTTGATVFVVMESHSMSLFFWRSMTQWLGGMGIIMLFIASLPKLGVAGRQMFRAEAPGPTEDNLRPRIRETAKILWTVYVSISVLELMLLLLFGMSFFDAATHTFTTMACGGFSPYAESVAAFNDPVIEGIITLFMFIAGANFALHYRTLFSDRKSLFRDNEFRFYLFIVLTATALLTFVLWHDPAIGPSGSFRYAIFQVVSILTTTGYATTDFNLWNDAGKVVLLCTMFIGGCAGSTAGGIKVVRLLLLFKYARQELFKTLHPKAVRPIKFNGKSVPAEVMNATISFVIIYFLIFLLSSMILSLLGLDLTSSVTASIATLGNIGPGFNIVGPMANFSTVPFAGKLLLIANMWIGRLEIFTVIVMLTPEFWRK